MILDATARFTLARQRADQARYAYVAEIAIDIEALDAQLRKAMKEGVDKWEWLDA